MKYYASSMFLTVLLGGQHYNLVEAVKLRQSTMIAEEASVLAEIEANTEVSANLLTEVDQSFPWTATHDCNWVHRRLRDKDYLTYDQQVAQQITLGTKWVDPTMPVNDAIQWPDVLTGSSGNLSGYATSTYLKWLRLQTQFPSSQGYSLYGTDGIASVNDIMQGSIGNCWFMAAASAIAEVPGRMEQAFGTKDQFNNGAGFFDVQLYLLGVPITIRIDDQVPAYNSFTQTLFAKVTNRGVWMNVLEKAFAKMYGNYSALVAGSPDRAVQSLIGTPGKQFSFSTMTTTQIYNEIVAAQNTSVLVGISGIAVTGSTNAMYGITPSHAFTILDAYRITLTTGAQVQLVKIRDPWATENTTTHLYRDTDLTSWTAVPAAEKTRIGYVQLNDGIFFMEITQFKAAYTSMTSNALLNGYTRSYWLTIDDKLVNPGKNINGGSTFTRHEFSITTAVDQNVIFQTNVHEARLYPKWTGCGLGIGVINVKTIVEWTLPGSTSSIWYQEGEYNLNSGNPYALKAGTTYSINLELWGGNTQIARDFSIVAWGSAGPVTFVSKQGLQNNSWW